MNNFLKDNYLGCCLIISIIFHYEQILNFITTSKYIDKLVKRSKIYILQLSDQNLHVSLFQFTIV